MEFIKSIPAWLEHRQANRDLMGVDAGVDKAKQDYRDVLREGSSNEEIKAKRSSIDAQIKPLQQALANGANPDITVAWRNVANDKAIKTSLLAKWLISPSTDAMAEALFEGGAKIDDDGLVQLANRAYAQAQAHPGKTQDVNLDEASNSALGKWVRRAVEQEIKNPGSLNWFSAALASDNEPGKSFERMKPAVRVLEKVFPGIEILLNSRRQDIGLSPLKIGGFDAMSQGEKDSLLFDIVHGRHTSVELRESEVLPAIKSLLEAGANPNAKEIHGEKINKKAYEEDLVVRALVLGEIDQFDALMAHGAKFDKTSVDQVLSNLFTRARSPHGYGGPGLNKIAASAVEAMEQHITIDWNQKVKWVSRVPHVQNSMSTDVQNTRPDEVSIGELMAEYFPDLIANNLSVDNAIGPRGDGPAPASSTPRSMR